MTIGTFISHNTKLTFHILQNLVKNDRIDIIDIDDKLFENKPLDILSIPKIPSSLKAQPKSFDCKTAIINADDKKILAMLKYTKTRVITYGFNSKSTITASSLNDGVMVVCIQRTLLTLNNEIVYQQEFSVQTDLAFRCAQELGFSVNNEPWSGSALIAESILSAVTIAVASGVRIEHITEPHKMSGIVHF